MAVWREVTPYCSDFSTYEEVATAFYCGRGGKGKAGGVYGKKLIVR